jgi:hypothetical protein
LAGTEAQICERDGKPPRSEIGQLATEMSKLVVSERLLKEYLDKRTAQLSM